MVFSKLRSIFGGSQEPSTTPPSQHRPERATRPPATPPFTGPASNGITRRWVDDPRPSSSSAHYGEPRNARSNGRIAADSRPVPSGLPQAPPPPARSTQTINVILFGEAGVGKSAVVNLIAQRRVAEVSSNATGCTMQSTPYDVNVDGTVFRIFDTVGLNQATEISRDPVSAHLDAIEHAYKLICDLRAAGGVHLLLFCMRGGARVTGMTRGNYRLFAEFLCQGGVPVAVVATCLEREPGRMEDWWTRNEAQIVGRFGIRNIGHACVTTLRDGDGSVYGPAKYAESQRKIREVLRGCSLSPMNGFLLEETNGVAMAAAALGILIRGGRQPSSKEIEKRLSKRLKMNKEDVKRILDTMNRVQHQYGGSAGRV